MLLGCCSAAVTQQQKVGGAEREGERDSVCAFVRCPLRLPSLPPSSPPHQVKARLETHNSNVASVLHMYKDRLVEVRAGRQIGCQWRMMRSWVSTAQGPAGGCKGS